MSFEQVKESVDNVPDQVEDLVKSNLEYYKLSLFRLLVKGASGFMKVFIIGISFLLLSFFLATAAAFALGDFLGNVALGFVCVGGIFFVLAMLIILLRKYLIDRPLLIMLSEFYFNDNDDLIINKRLKQNG